MRDQADLKAILKKLIADGENEVVEFKQADNFYKSSEIGKYFSALSNEANLQEINSAWLVFGIDDKTRSTIGTDYRPDHKHLMAVKNEVHNGLDPSLTFREIHELTLPEGRVILFEIPSAPAGIPVGWSGHHYGRAGESLTSLGMDKADTIRAQSPAEWSAAPVKAANVSDLDEGAMQRARQIFWEKYSSRFSEAEVHGWSTEDFLRRISLLNGDKLTRAAILLLGREESANLLNPNPAQITWKLDAEEKAYHHYGPPFLLNTSAIYQRIRNLRIRLLPDNELIQQEVEKYDQEIILEAFHNAIAHQDYNQNARILITEFKDSLEIENSGTFYEGAPDEYVEGKVTPRRYRNTVLVKAMAHLGMIDTMGYGIHKMHRLQADRFFPLPDYDISAGNSVKLRIYGKIMDPAYTRLLLQKTGIPLHDILALDRIQKRIPVPDENIVKRLRKTGWIEGRKPNLHVSAEVAKATSSKADYIRTRAQDNAHYEKLLLDYLGTFKKATRSEINDLLLNKLSEALTQAQRKCKISNLLTSLKAQGKIDNQGSRRKPQWVLLNQEN